jgi:FdhD protein
LVQIDGAGLDELSVAILQELALAPRNSAMSLPRLGKQLGVGVSVLMRRLSALGQARIGGVDGPDWVRVTQSEDRWTAALTEAGRAFWLEQVSPRALCAGSRLTSG